MLYPGYDLAIFTEDFSSDPTASPKFTDLVNWNLNSGSVDIGGYISGIPGKSVDMDGDNNAVIESKEPIQFYPGTYKVSFANLNNNAGSGNSIQVNIGTLFNQTFGAPSTLQYAQATFTVSTATAATMKFTQLCIHSDRSGNFIGDIKISRVFDESYAINNGSNDPNNDIVSITASPANFTCADVGQPLDVVLEVTDGQGKRPLV